jgi:phage-related protein
MPKTAIKFYRDDDGSVPVLDWLTDLAVRNRKAYDKCVYLLDLLGEFGSELRRPRADFLRDGVYELRTKVGNVNYRLLYGFVGKDVALLTAGLTKEKKVPDKEIDRAVERIARYKVNPARHGYDEEKNRG